MNAVDIGRLKVIAESKPALAYTLERIRQRQRNTANLDYNRLFREVKEIYKTLTKEEFKEVFSLLEQVGLGQLHYDRRRKSFVFIWKVRVLDFKKAILEGRSEVVQSPSMIPSKDNVTKLQPKERPLYQEPNATNGIVIKFNKDGSTEFKVQVEDLSPNNASKLAQFIKQMSN